MQWGIKLHIKCEDACLVCGKNYLKDPSNLGDYHAGALLRYCPECGRMLPFLSIDYEIKNELSNNQKRRFGTRIAKIKNLDYAVMSFIIKDLRRINSKKEFFERFKTEVKKNFEIEDLGDIETLI